MVSLRRVCGPDGSGGCHRAPVLRARQGLVFVEPAENSVSSRTAVQTARRRRLLHGAQSTRPSTRRRRRAAGLLGGGRRRVAAGCDTVRRAGVGAAQSAAVGVRVGHRPRRLDHDGLSRALAEFTPVIKYRQGCRGDGISIPVLTPYPYPLGSSYPRRSQGLPWGRNFYPRTYPIPIPIGILIPTAESRAAVGTEFLSPYLPQFAKHLTKNARLFLDAIHLQNRKIV